VVSSDNFRTELAELTSRRGVDVVVDPVGRDRFIDSLRCLSTEGRQLVIGFTAGDIPSVRVNRLLLTNTPGAGVTGTGRLTSYHR
jgi:NADPH2:quinone reductase